MIWKRRQLIFWWLISAAVVAGVTAWLVLNWHVRTQHGNIMHGASLKNARQWLEKNLSLTKEQHVKLESFTEAAEKEQEKERRYVLVAEKDVAEALEGGDENSPALEAALEKLTHSRAALQRTVIKYYLKICTVLDDSQRKAFLDWNSAQFDPP